jgi:hypothetical protein
MKKVIKSQVSINGNSTIDLRKRNPLTILTYLLNEVSEIIGEDNKTFRQHELFRDSNLGFRFKGSLCEKEYSKDSLNLNLWMNPYDKEDGFYKFRNHKYGIVIDCDNNMVYIVSSSGYKRGKYLKTSQVMEFFLYRRLSVIKCYDLNKVETDTETINKETIKPSKKVKRLATTAKKL